MSDRINILIVDDHPAICQALEQTIEDEMDMAVCATAHTSDDAIDHLDTHEPDAVILDISLKDSYGLDLISYVNSFHENTPIVVYSMFDEAVYAERAIKAGAKAYLMKTEPTRKLVEAIRSVSRGSVYLSEAMTAHVVNRLGSNGSSQPGLSVDSFTDRELAVFQMLGQGYSMAEITDRLNLNRKTVEHYRRQAKEKLGLDTTSELLQYAIQWTQAQPAREKTNED
jgi:DNA-binding NarL/FixJ family response regulator